MTLQEALTNAHIDKILDAMGYDLFLFILRVF